MKSHLRRLENRLIVFSALTVVLGGALLLVPDASTSVKKESLPLAFPDFASGAIRQIELTRGDEKLVLQQAAEERWVLASHFRYPLNTPPQRLLDAIASARISSEVTTRADTFGKYAGSRGWIDVSAVDTRGKVALHFAIGRYQYPETYLRLGSGKAQRIVKATGISETEAGLEVRSWIETRMWPSLSSKNFVRMDIEQRADKRTITLVKRGESPADVEMAVPGKDEKGEKLYWMASPRQADAKTLAVEDVAREFTGMLIQDVVAGSTTPAKDAEYGFDKPEIVATLYHKVNDQVSKYKLTIGKRVPDKELWYARRGGDSWVFLVSSSGGVSRMRQAPEEFLPKKEEPKKDG